MDVDDAVALVMTFWTLLAMQMAGWDHCQLPWCRFEVSSGSNTGTNLSSFVPPCCLPCRCLHICFVASWEKSRPMATSIFPFDKLSEPLSSRQRLLIRCFTAQFRQPRIKTGGTLLCLHSSTATVLGGLSISECTVMWGAPTGDCYLENYGPWLAFDNQLDGRVAAMLSKGRAVQQRLARGRNALALPSVDLGLERRGINWEKCCLLPCNICQATSSRWSKLPFLPWICWMQSQKALISWIAPMQPRYSLYARWMYLDGI